MRGDYDNASVGLGKRSEKLEHVGWQRRLHGSWPLTWPNLGYVPQLAPTPSIQPQPCLAQALDSFLLPRHYTQNTVHAQKGTF